MASPEEAVDHGTTAVGAEIGAESGGAGAGALAWLIGLGLFMWWSKENFSK